MPWTEVVAGKLVVVPFAVAVVCEVLLLVWVAGEVLSLTGVEFTPSVLDWVAFAVPLPALAPLALGGPFLALAPAGYGLNLGGR